ncbi:hypothetical protein K474DRAFT_1594707 [Panus rudis PR-1116 ss-1]|nr:hypothetical protein K474DRAFT_1594707 [Panus rudis PR-1116 ss-1]
MAQFSDLPIELLVLILQHIPKPAHLAKICLVDKAFDKFGREQLYRQIYIYAWHKDAKLKVIKLFQTLATSPSLARYVEKLTIRDFPRAVLLGKREEIISLCLLGIRNCVNLRACTWTRHGSISTALLEAFQQLPHLTDLEINGENHWQYKADTLRHFNHLRKLSLIMPSSSVVGILHEWIPVTAHTLRHLSLICKSTAVITDQLLEDIGPSLVNLEHLYLVGCPKVTHRGLLAAISSSQHGLLSLGIEGVSPTFDMGQFADHCLSSGVLRRLRSITLAVHVVSTQPTKTLTDGTNVSRWSAQVVEMLSQSPLELLHISTLGGDVGGELSNDFCSMLLSTHASRLRRFSVHRMRISTDAIKQICSRCDHLEQLFVVTEQDDLDSLCDALSLTRSLHTLHVNRPLEEHSETLPVVPKDRILKVVRRCGSELQQVGFNTRVWQVQRNVIRKEDASLDIELDLAPYEHPEIPEQFLVVRT